MTSHLSRSSLPLRAGFKTCIASTSKQSFATSSVCCAENQSTTSQTPSMQSTQTQMTPPSFRGRRSEGPSSNERQGDRRPERQGGRQQEGGGGRRRPARVSPLPPPYKEWFSGEGKQYEDAPPGRGPFWIGETPFPLNPSFDPPPPLSQRQKQSIWTLHSSDPANTIRVLSGKFGISMERIHAILRLQALESEWTKRGKVLQMPFNKNMERLLGAVEKASGSTMEPSSATLSENNSFRGPILEEFGMESGSEKSKSAIAPALLKEKEERQTRMQTLPTGGPARRGPSKTVKIVRMGVERAPIKFVDVSQRPTSYIGAGVIERNQRRAEKRKAYKAKKATGKATSNAEQ
ncbi:hypothetical protein CBS101457_000548 [Exobasidium rhododendri]|nr:hypothetical protein CBS101457_000548 [Exobasidium rhododendri]